MSENEQLIEIENEILKQYDERKEIYDYTCNTYIRVIKELLHRSSILYNTIEGRVKDRDSLKRKIEKKRKYKNINELTDIVGIRIITYYSDDVDKIAELISNEFLVDKDNTIDKRKAIEPDRFGYLSLHYIISLNSIRGSLTEYLFIKNIKVEVQIRTILQHAWAESEHDLGYKSEMTIPNEFKRKFSRLAGLLELADSEFVQIRNGLQEYSEQVTTQLVNKETNDILIDCISLKIYILHNPLIQQMNESISKHCNIDLRDSDENDYIEIIEKLKWFGCKKMKDLDLLLIQYKELALKIAYDFLGHNELEKCYMGETISVFYTLYAYIVSGKFTEKQVMEYCKFIEGDGDELYSKLIEYKGEKRSHKEIE